MRADETQQVDALEIRELSKAFGATKALISASFTVEGSTVHGLLGENGSGKSTLVKILSGYHVPDGGGVNVWGSPVKLPIRPGGYREIGMSFVHQSLGLARALSVTENLRIAEITEPRRLNIAWRRERAIARETFARYGIALEPSLPVASLTRSQQAVLAIVRAVEELRDGEGEFRRGLLVLDEPTGSFTIPEKEWLYRTIRSFTARGGGVLFISHDIDEIFEITDKVTVLRDGRVQATVETESVTGTQLAELIVGRHVSLGDRGNAGPSSASEVADGEQPTSRELIEVSSLTGETVVDVDLSVRPGEVVGLTGLAGSGFEEVLPLVFGVTPAITGSLKIGGRNEKLSRMTPQRAIRAGIAMVPGDRERAGCVLELSISDNVTLCSLDEYRTPLGLNRKRMSTAARAAIGHYGVRASGPASAVGTLSGGNQQKVLLAKWLATKPEVLLLQEPTVGLDIGARLDIFEVIQAFAQRGAAVICASSDWEQLATICSRVIIFANGRVASEVSEDLSESVIGHECYRVSTLSGSSIGHPA